MSPFRKSKAASSIDASVIKFSIKDNAGKKINVMITGEDESLDEIYEYQDSVYQSQRVKTLKEETQRYPPQARYTSEQGNKFSGSYRKGPPSAQKQPMSKQKSPVTTEGTQLTQVYKLQEEKVAVARPRENSLETNLSGSPSRPQNSIGSTKPAPVPVK